MKRPLITELRNRGLELQFSRLRLSWVRGLVADEVSLGQTEHLYRPRLLAKQARLGISFTALLHKRVEVHSVALHDGTVVIPMPVTNGAPRDIVLDNIHWELEFLPGDEWALQRFTAELLGGKLSVSGRITHASELRDWLMRREPSATTAFENRLRRLAEVFDQIEFIGSPELRLNVDGDGRDMDSFRARLVATAPAADTSWGTLRGGTLVARLLPATTNDSPRASLVLDAQEAFTPWADTTNFNLKVEFNTFPGQTNVEKAVMKITAAQAVTRWARATNLTAEIRLTAVPDEANLVDGTLAIQADSGQTKWVEGRTITANASWRHSLTNPVPLLGEIRLSAKEARSGLGLATNVSLVTRLSEAVNKDVRSDPSWGWWTNLAPYRLAWELEIGNASIRDVLARHVTSAGTWTAPHLLITNLHANLQEHSFQAEGDLDVGTRRTNLRAKSSIDPHQIESLLTLDARKWLSQFSWNKAPEVGGSLSLVLPQWSDPKPDWRNEVRPTLVIDGSFVLDAGGEYRKIQFSSARSHILYSNETWVLPDLFVTRPEGSLSATHRADERTGEFTWKLTSSFSTPIIRPLLSTNEQEGFDLLTLSQPPALEAEIGGVSHQDDKLWFRGQVALTNFSFRSQSFSGVQTSFDYTNKVLRFIDPRAQRDNQLLRADFVIADFNSEQIYITNGFSTAEPLPIARAIGTKVGQVIEPYQFALPPVVRVWGAVPMHGEEGADLRFTVDGGPFHWHRFTVPRIQGDVHWAGLQLLLTNVKVDFYGGKAEGTAQFYFDRGQGTEYEFAFSATNAILQDLMADYFNRTNSLEGLLNGTVVITRANSEDWRQTQGFGAIDLSDGLIWDIPLFGVLSPVLDNIVPGLGSSRASSATCSFTIRNGVITSGDLEARSPAMRLKYRGNVDLEGVVDARVEAELLRDMWVLGPLVSTVFWPVTKMFEYRATGTLYDPNLEPVYIFPKLVKIPFQPLRIFRGLFPTENSGERAPPKQAGDK